MDERILAFVKKHTERGVHADSIKKYLLEKGLDIKIVEEHIEQVMGRKKNKIYTIATILLIIIIVSVAFFIFKNYSSKKDTSGFENVKDVPQQQPSVNLSQANQNTKTNICACDLNPTICDSSACACDPLCASQSNSTVVPPPTQNITPLMNLTVTCTCDISPSICDSASCTCDPMCTSRNNQTIVQPPPQNITPPMNPQVTCTCDISPSICDSASCTCDPLCVSQSNSTVVPPPQPPQNSSLPPPTNMCTCDINPAICDAPSCICDPMCKS